jgi:hypothetical protein
MGEGNIESILSIETGLRELASLKAIFWTLIIFCMLLFFFYFKLEQNLSLIIHV